MSNDRLSIYEEILYTKNMIKNQKNKIFIFSSGYNLKFISKRSFLYHLKLMNKHLMDYEAKLYILRQQLKAINTPKEKRCTNCKNFRLHETKNFPDSIGYCKVQSLLNSMKCITENSNKYFYRTCESFEQK